MNKVSKLTYVALVLVAFGTANVAAAGQGTVRAVFKYTGCPGSNQIGVGAFADWGPIGMQKINFNT